MVKYADRAFLSINGTRLLDIQSASLKRNYNAKPVPSMTPDFFNRGVVQGNTDIDITFTLAVENALARPKLEAIDYLNNSISLTFVCGADQYVANDLFKKDAEDNAGGIGDEVKATFNFGALSLVDSKGNSALFNVQL